MSDATLIFGGKLLPATETDYGSQDLLLEGLCVVWDSIDSEGESFLRGAFDKSVKAFLAGSAPLCYNHRPGAILGKVLDLKETSAGIWMTARVDAAIRKHPELAVIYEQIKRGTIRGLSCGGFFSRVQTPDGPRISTARVTEISATALPTDEKPRFAVVAGKALTEYDAAMAEIAELESLRAAYGRLALAESNLAVAENLLRAR
jgi:HK97 family phage prohead protease